MGFVTVLSRDPVLRSLLRSREGVSAVASARVPGRLLRLVRERPVTTVVVDSDAFAESWAPEAILREMAHRFPSVGAVFVARAGLSPVTLLQLGRAGIPGLELLPASDLTHGLPGSLARAARNGTRARVLQAVGGQLDGWSRDFIGTTLDAAIVGWGADQLAARFEWTRAHLGVRLRSHGLPSPGKLLLWARMLHAARWIPEDGRTAESVSRQLDYANGATFRRALRATLGCTPTELVEQGGFAPALGTFLDVCGVVDSVEDRRAVA